MNSEVREILQQVYTDHKLREDDLDYTIADRYKADLNRLSKLNNCCFFIVDLHKIEYLFTSDNFRSIFGYIPVADSSVGQFDNKLLDSRIHPDDFKEYKRIQLKIGEFVMQQSKEDRVTYKHVFEFRVQNTQGQYIRVSWERQPLETDKSGNLWLMLGTINILSNQTDMEALKSFFIHLKTGERFDFYPFDEIPFELTPREMEILQLIQQGLLSKEIARRLTISVNTVNIHRQNILHKMQVDNSLEAVNYARSLRLLK